MCLSPHLGTETDPVSETLCFLLSRIPDDVKVQTSGNSNRISAHKNIQHMEMSITTFQPEITSAILHTLKSWSYCGTEFVKELTSGLTKTAIPTLLRSRSFRNVYTCI
jgi:hypothetical protein